MKQIVMLLLCSIFFNSVVHSQIFPTHNPIWSAFIYKKNPVTGDYEGFPDKEVSINIKYKNTMGEVVYIENYETILDPISFVKIALGTGEIDPESPVEDLTFALFPKTLCYTIEVQTDEGSFITMGEHEFGSSPYALLAETTQNAENADALGNNDWVGEEIDNWDEPQISSYSFPVLVSGAPPESSFFDVINLDKFFGKDSSPSAVNQTEIAYYQVGTGEYTPVVFSQNPVPEIEGFLTNCFESDENLYDGAVFKFLQAEHPPLSHATSAVYAENIYDPLGVGVFANGASRGSYNQGQTGILGLTVGTGNGAASWSRVAAAPAPGGFKYGVFAEDQGLAGSWAAAIFGNGFYTRTWSQSSDRRLKTEIRTQSNGLNKVMQLRPAQYRYINDSPYRLPAGIHHGFIAQEMEDVLPELVSNITMPMSMEPDKLATCETTEFKAINYIELIPILTSAIQELHSSLMELNAKIEAQNSEIEKLKKALEVANKPK